MSQPQGTDTETLERLFGRTDLDPLWIAEPSLELAPTVCQALEARAGQGWYGYEVRPQSLIDSFWEWSRTRHGWDGNDAGLHTMVSPSVGTSIGVLIDQLSQPGEGIIIQPPVFTDFKPLITHNERVVARNALVLEEDGSPAGESYRIDFEGLTEVAADPANRLLILCNPHNPVGRVWTPDELRRVAEICADNDVFVLADEIHADLALPPHRFMPFASVAAGMGVRWAAVHGPIKTFGLAGVCDTLLIAADDELAERFQAVSSRFHLTRNNVFGLAAFEAAYSSGGPWLDELIARVVANTELLDARLPDPVRLVRPEATYLAWVDMRELGLEVPELAGWLASEAGMAVSPGHWFGREGAGFARVTTAVPPEMLAAAADRLTAAVGRRAGG